MNLILRNSDVVLKQKDLINLYSFKKFPVFMGCTNQEKKLDLLADMNWSIAKGSGAIQLNPLLPLDVIYKEQHGSGCVGDLWNQHHLAFAKFVHFFNFKTVLEIGGLHGILSKLYQDLDETIDWTIIEPNPIPVNGVTAHFIKGYFDDQFKFNKQADAVIHSHVFEHIYDPHIFLNHISDFLSDEKYMLFSVPNLQEMLKRKYNNALNFEHTIFLTEPYIEYLLSKYHFRVIKKEYFKEDHSIFYACIRDSKIHSSHLTRELFEYNKKLFLEYIDYHHQLIDELNSKIKILKKDQKLYLFGAHIFSQYLISFGLNVNHLDCIIDNDVNKQGKRLYGTDLKVFSPKILNKDKNPVVLLKAGVYDQEIKKDILENVNSNTFFL
jgi:2-polyprenyl-3-methyl-5-hydroxy-6-metoxy-1,4-benzoquinol methylase